jgi:hypothetical protein
MAKTVILLSGKKNTGKDTAGKLIKAMFKCKKCRGRGRTSSTMPCMKCHGDGSRVQTMSFADPLKKFCIDVLGLTSEQCYGPSTHRETASPIKWSDINLRYSRIHGEKWMEPGKWETCMSARDVLQIVGTDVLRTFYKGIWANAAYLAAKRSEREIVVFTDTRFPNEITEFQKHHEDEELDSLVVIRMYRPGNTVVDNHPSELALDDWDAMGKWPNSIHNDDSQDVLAERLRSILINKYGLM